MRPERDQQLWGYMRSGSNCFRLPTTAIRDPSLISSREMNPRLLKATVHDKRAR